MYITIKKKITKDEKYKYTLNLKHNSEDHVNLWAFNNQRTTKTRPRSINLSNDMIPIFDQGSIGSCTGNAISACYAYQYKLQHNSEMEIKTYIPSRLFIYYNERLLSNRVSIDSGSSIKDGIKAINQFGTCPEELWPYIPEQFDCVSKDVQLYSRQKQLSMLRLN